MNFWERNCSRRQFLKEGCLFTFGLGASPLLLNLFSKSFAATSLPFIHEARYYKKVDKQTVQCQLCPRGCRLTDGQRSWCRAREPKNGKLYSLVYGLPCAVHIDPIEKKPLFHFLPGTSIFSISTAGCNFRCKFCQNWQISQFPPEETQNYSLPPEEVVKKTIECKCPSIAYTYTEPSIFFEYMLDTAKLAKKQGLKNMYHSNGSLNPEPAKEIAQYLDGANVDLKAFTEKFYNEISEGFLERTLDTLKILKKNGVHLEITNLVIPTLNDDPEKIKAMCFWIKENLDDQTPLHFTRFWPMYKLKNLNPTPVETLEKTREVAISQGLKFVYIGNVPGHSAEHTYCPDCKKILIRRAGFTVLENNIGKDGKCKFCKRYIPGVWS